MRHPPLLVTLQLFLPPRLHAFLTIMSHHLKALAQTLRWDSKSDLQLVVSEIHVLKENSGGNPECSR